MPPSGRHRGRYPYDRPPEQSSPTIRTLVVLALVALAGLSIVLAVLVDGA